MIFCDWLDVTFPPGTAPYPELNKLLVGLGFEVLDVFGKTKFMYRPPNCDGRGMFEIQQGNSWDRVSMSGVACSALRDLGAWFEVLTMISDQPHKVTRVDVTLDLPMDGADLVDAMRVRYPAAVHLGRKSLQTTLYIQQRPDGRESGTWYAGLRSRAQVTAKVYDKAWEVFCNRGGLEVLPCGRVEVTVRGSYGITLQDAAAPTALFWECASPAILQAPEDAPMRANITDLGWKAQPRVFDPAQVLRRRIEAMAELDALALVADDLGPGGRQYLLQLLQRRLSSVQPGSGVTTADVSTPSACA